MVDVYFVLYIYLFFIKFSFIVSKRFFFFFFLRRKILAGKRKQLIGSRGVRRSEFVDATSASPPD